MLKAGAGDPLWALLHITVSPLTLAFHLFRSFWAGFGLFLAYIMTGMAFLPLHRRPAFYIFDIGFYFPVATWFWIAAVPICRATIKMRIQRQSG